MDYLIFFFIFFIFLILIIYGLPYKRTYFNNQIAYLQNENIKENFKTSSETDVKQGASTFYDWGLRDSNDVPEECDIEPPPKSKSCSGGKCLGDKKTYVQNDYYIYPEEKKPEQPTCGNCEAYKCKNIDRYVLKSSVPPCPDMSEYALKSMVKPCPDLKDYIRKSEIPPCPERPDLTKYVLKSQVPACPTPVVCPDCPVCPPAYKYIQDDPRFKNWLIRFEDDVEEKINKLYIRKTDCNKIKEESYKKGVEEGKNNAYKSIAEGAGPDTLKKCLRSGSAENKKPSGGQNIRYLNDKIRDQNRDNKNRKDNKDNRDNRNNQVNRDRMELDRERNRLANLEKKLEFEKNTRREEKLSSSNDQKPSKTSGNDDFVLGWDPTSLGFGAINYQMKRPNIK
jgi:hypothetical protein